MESRRRKQLQSVILASLSNLKLNPQSNRWNPRIDLFSIRVAQLNSRRHQISELALIIPCGTSSPGRIPPSPPIRPVWEYTFPFKEPSRFRPNTPRRRRWNVKRDFFLRPSPPPSRATSRTGRRVGRGSSGGGNRLIIPHTLPPESDPGRAGGVDGNRRRSRYPAVWKLNGYRSRVNIPSLI